MTFLMLALALTLGLFAAVLGFLALGRHIGKRRLAAQVAPAEFGAVEGAVFGLLGLLLAFTFSGAVGRFDDRKRLITVEANAIGTAWLRIDVAPADARPQLRALFRRYLDSRLETYRQAGEAYAAHAEFARSTALQGEIWTLAVASCGSAEASPRACSLLLPSLNDMIDITTTRLMATRMHPPAAIFAMLVALTLAGALLAGHAMAASKAWSWMHAVAFAAAMAVTIYVIVDIEYPRLGFIRVDSADEVLMDLRRSMGETPQP
jgi:CDP-diglyceride synthetase